MKFSLCITTDYKNNKQLDEVTESIHDLNIPEYEILIIGGKDFHNENRVTQLYVEESKKPGWINQKNNVLCQNAKYENIVLLHDYYLFDGGWYKSFLDFGDDWDICSNQQLLITGERHFTDWVTWDDPVFPRYSALPYDEWSRTKHMYISGGYYILKKELAMKEPLNEEMLWGSAEDVEWSLRVREKYIMKCNGDAIVKHNKWHRDAK